MLYKKDYIRNEAEMQDEVRTYDIRIRSLPHTLLTPISLPFTTELAKELANESNLRVTEELLLFVVFVHGIGTQCTLDSGVSR
jgi:hypothetical protein